MAKQADPKSSPVPTGAPPTSGIDASAPIMKKTRSNSIATTKSVLFDIEPMTTTEAPPSTPPPSQPAAFKPTQTIHTSHVPLHKYQLTHNLLYERHFYGESYISAHLARLQNGVFISPNIHPSSGPDHQEESLAKIFVTFVAVSFTMHPSISEDHRFSSAVVEIKATNTAGRELRVLRFAPHLAFGRISSASLKWNFQLGASLGVAQGPAKADLEPKVGFEKDLVVGSFMRIQGSTRSVPPSQVAGPRIPDTVVVWSLEENTQQQGGLPREFTFVFLLERPLPAKNRYTSTSQVPTPTPSTLQQAPTTATNASQESSCCATKSERIAGIDVNVQDNKIDQAARPTSPPPKKLVKKTIELAHSLASRAQQISEELADCIHDKAQELENDLSKTLQPVDPEPFRITGALPNARKFSNASKVELDKVFSPIHFHISVRPRITNAPDKSTSFAASEFDESIVEGQVGQRFGAVGEGDDEAGEQVLVDGLYNFAEMSGHFEELVELPGSSVATIEPSLPAK